MKQSKRDSAPEHPLKNVVWGRIYERVGQYWKALAVAIFFMALAAATQPTLALAMKPLLDEGITGAKPDYVWQVPLAIIVLIFFRGVCTFFSDYLLAWVANNVLLKLRADMFTRLLAMPDSEYKKGDSGRLLNRFTVDAQNIAFAANSVMTVLVRESLVVLSLLGVLFYMSWQLALIILVIMPASVFVSRIFMKRLRRINRETIATNAQMTEVVNEGISGQRVIKLFDGYGYENERFQYVNGRQRRHQMRAAIADAALRPIAQMIIAFAVAITIGVALHEADSGVLTVGSFAAFMAALAQIFDPVRRLTNVVGHMQKMLASAESVFDLVDHAGEDHDRGKQFAGKVKGKIEFDQVSHRFTDAERDTLSNISLTVEPGQVLALVGRSGSGKTTLVNMLPRFVDPGQGQIRIDGQDIAEVSLRNLRSQLSLVSQDVVLFNGTIAANVGYGTLGNASEQQIRDALAAANLLSFVESLPNGLYTEVGENATRLSGGQRQRLAIARALIKDAPILILDEATSALDNESERQVQASLETLMKGRTTLVIAHRLSTVQNAHRIVVLDDGEILETGSHSELLEKDGAYAALYKMQFRK
ncbi:lipid A export permease/ATP-binding protein MsbA [Orrella marina]|uniref:Lipid A export permease/ATP-binding protein MsbA n=1 Tax=Orrella marina TaxID=2163011 RepID=A0A2R4XFQ8_9BURK|nr:lipid A export permease/ATP-binding protein MsbA [Orrella marina]AWB32634.1 lipid A export permease/ATP-binding protein MsbA [Orrella marina]